MLAYDNVSFIPQWFSDALCRVSTGGDLKARQLYTDGEQYVVDLRNPVVLNGVPDAATSQDLVSRAIMISPPVIPEGERLTKSEIDGRLAKVLPGVLGALLDQLSAGLRNTHLNPGSLPRMADCALWVTRCTGSEEWLNVYRENVRQAAEIGLESSPTYAGVRQLPGRPLRDRVHEGAEGSGPVARDKRRAARSAPGPPGVLGVGRQAPPRQPPCPSQRPEAGRDGHATAGDRGEAHEIKRTEAHSGQKDGAQG